MPSPSYHGYRTVPSALSLLLLATALTACGNKDEATVPSPASGQRLVIAMRSIDDVKPVAATLTTHQMGEAIARISGVLISLKVREGDTVTRGQVIGYVQDQKINLQTGAYDQAAVAVQAQADLAHANLKRSQVLFDKGIYAQAKLDQDKAAAAAADANAEAARAQGAASGEASRQGEIVAPATGKVIHAGIPLGSVVMAGQSVATITVGNRVVRIELPEAQAQALSLTQTLSLEAGGTKATGTVVEIYPAVTDGQIIADITPTGLDRLAIGRNVVAYVGVGKRKAIVVPEPFVSTRYGLDYVRVLQNGVVMETTVQTAPTGSPGLIEILDGIRPGDQILSYGATR